MGRSKTLADRGATTTWVLLTVLLVVPVLVVGAWWLVATAENPTAAAAPVEPLLVPVTRQDVRAETTVGVTIGDVPGREAAVAVAGTVTKAPEVGAVLTDGVEVLRVDDRPVRAIVSTAPPWRALVAGDRGADVARLQEFLTRLDLYHGPADGRFGSALGRAVVQFNVDAGLGRDVTGFDPATVVWVGPAPLDVVESLVPVGTAVAPGVGVVRGPAQAGAVVVTEPQGGIAALGDFGASATLDVGGTLVTYVPASGSIGAPDAVELIRAALAPAVEGTARVTAATPLPVAVVPASSLVQGADGTLCVYADADSSPVVVAPVGGGVGWTHLPADIALDRVLANPGRSGPAVPCGS